MHEPDEFVVVSRVVGVDTDLECGVRRSEIVERFAEERLDVGARDRLEPAAVARVVEKEVGDGTEQVALPVREGSRGR